MMRTYEGVFDGQGLRVAVVAARFNESISQRLLEGAVDCLRRQGVADEDISIARVPGAFELPLAAQRLAESREIDAVVCVGTVIRGSTPHFEHVATQAASGITAATLATGVPITFGVLTTDDRDQADERAGGKLGNKGFEAAQAALEMANLLAVLPKPQSEI
jgi:6,7-dimethyl-8-ribityllumazine synthase